MDPEGQWLHPAQDPRAPKSIVSPPPLPQTPNKTKKNIKKR